ncbi:MAG TPA: hypothetical protein VL361_03755, partial [Candidatus Limnocylindrales bacterium]|nr:hypothetical protein [Candidatus Limnocylindrales bacterium]
MKKLASLAVLGVVALVSTIAQDTNKLAEPLMIQAQGSFMVGGTVITNPGTYNATNRSPSGQTLHGDHAYVFYQVP